MYGLSLRQALWALALINALAPSHADGNIGCLFSAPLCVEGVEWCYDDFAFGKCIPVYEEESEEGALYRYDMGPEQLQWFEGELQRLAARGYRWEHAYTQCVLQAMLLTLQQNIDLSNVNTKICEHFADPTLTSDTSESEIVNPEMEPEETAFIRYTPNAAVGVDSDFANEIYNPPIVPEDNPNIGDIETETPSDKLRDLMLMTDNEESPVILPFNGFRERLQAEGKGRTKTNVHLNLIDKEKKSVNEMMAQNDPNIGYTDEERLGAHFRKFKMPPKALEYFTKDGLSALDEEVRSNAYKNYIQSFESKNFPFQYEDPSDIPESRIYDEDLDELPIDPDSGELDAYRAKGKPPGFEGKHGKNMDRNIVNYMRDMIKSKPKQDAIYAEGGPLNPEELQGENYKFYSDDLQDLLNNEWGFKRRERDDVKKPGPRLNAKALKILYHNNSVAAEDPAHTLKNSKHTEHNHNDFDYDPAYAYVLLKNGLLTNWAKGISFISKIEEMLGLDKNSFSNPRVDLREVTFKVEKNNKGYDAVDVARRVDDIKDDLLRETGAQIISTGVGDRSKRPIMRHVASPDTLIFGLELPVFLALVGSFSVLVVGAIIFAILLKKDMSGKKKSQGLSSAAEIDAEATRDYQELCRARMSGKWSGQQTAANASSNPAEPAQRITSLSREPDGNSPSTRSSTSSWSEEPALTNMDISTGHMVLAYMEDHLRNKDRLEQEWRALCAYEAEPCATTSALKPENSAKNRYADVLPYDHSRVILNTLSNHVGSDYINASTITDHDPRNPAYIASAGPLPHTAPDFWQMVWEQGSVVMVMLTRLTENGQQLCHRYWPEEGSELYHIYEVHLVSEHIWCDDYLVRSFYLKNQRTGETRTVTQFHFLSWPENGVPASTKALLEFRRKVNKSYRGRSCPIVVHCSDGAGRSGTYCLIDMVLNRMAKGAKEIDIAATLEHIRDQRTRTVATKQQFEFVLMAVAEEVLRHEEFSEGCEAACNGPYANRWSKTMVGYGPEDTHFVVELTYNYGVTHYEQGNDFLGITVQSSESLKRAQTNNWPIKEHNGLKYVEAPGGYKFYIVDKPQPVDKDPVVKVSLASSNLAKSIAYWNGLLTLKLYEKTDKTALLGYSDDQAKLELVDIGEPINRAKAYGRIAFSCPFDEQPVIDKKIQDANETILTPLISLDTPGKATVRVIILADPDGHEICFVDDESFRQLSQVDPSSDAELDKFIKSDKSRA